MNTAKLLARIVAISLLVSGCKFEVERANRPEPAVKISNPIEDMLRSSPVGEQREGIAAVILVDTSGSMAEKVAGVAGELTPKINIAKRSVLDLVRQFEQYARENPEKKISLGIYEFSSRKNEAPVREVVKNRTPDVSEAESAIHRLRAGGGTPIGDAMIVAKRALDDAALSRRHMAVVTDGENTQGYNPGDVADVISRGDAEQRVSIYFIAFDVAADSFNSVRAAGGLILGAANESDLKQAIDFILTGKILVEQPPAPASR
jgi:Mg-chelatase subunit ChlD